MARFLALFLTAVYKQLYRDMGADMRSADTRVHALSAVCRHPTILHARFHRERTRFDATGTAKSGERIVFRLARESPRRARQRTRTERS